MIKEKEIVFLDIECYRNYLLIMFRRLKDGKVISYEKFNESQLESKSIHHVLNKYTIVTFNGNFYDICILEAALSGFSNEDIFKVSKYLIEGNNQPWEARKQFGFTSMKSIDTIDIINVAPLKASLKIYGGRIHAKKMQDLPINVNAEILNNQREIMKVYCANDLELTELLYKKLIGEINLRRDMSKEYGIDLRSKSDAQIAEAVIAHEFEQMGLPKPKRISIPVGTEYKFNPPSYMSFETELLSEIFNEFRNNYFTVGKSGHIELPDSLKNKKFKIGDTDYKIGIGGIHSVEKKTMYRSNKNTIIRDYDVASYYPNIILNNRLAPKTLGSNFLTVYQRIVDRRLKAKREGNKVVNESLKITINGSFGKLANKWSFLYAPDLMMHVTVIGQLSLLMLIEKIELSGTSVISANTDGIVVKMKPEQEPIVESIVEEWEFETGYEMEANNYKILASRDVNNYIAIKEGEVKSKGAYAEPNLKINPSTDISTLAVKLFLEKDIPIEKTIRECDDIRQFVVVRTVNPGAVKEGKQLGKAIRWYYSKDELDAIFYINTGNKVPKSDGGKPCMELPEKLPKDIDYEWYIEKANTILKEIGYKVGL